LAVGIYCFFEKLGPYAFDSTYCTPGCTDSGVLLVFTILCTALLNGSVDAGYYFHVAEVLHKNALCAAGNISHTQ
jgi:hypothetical protein